MTNGIKANPAVRAINEGIIVGLANHTVLIAKGGTELPIDDSAAPIRCAAGELMAARRGAEGRDQKSEGAADR